MMMRFLFPLLLMAPAAFALDCENPPTSGFGGADYRAYADWCVACGGTPSNSGGVSCARGPNWGRDGQGSNGGNRSGDFLLDFASGGAYSREKQTRRAETLNQQALDQWIAGDRQRRREIHDRVVGEMKLGENASAGYSARATYVVPVPQTQSAQGNPPRALEQCAISPDGKIRPDKNQVVCNALTCGATDRIPVCCPSDYPILNPCDCKCYKAAFHFDCSRYMSCRHFEVNE